MGQGDPGSEHQGGLRRQESLIEIERCYVFTGAHLCKSVVRVHRSRRPEEVFDEGLRCHASKWLSYRRQRYRECELLSPHDRDHLTEIGVRGRKILGQMPGDDPGIGSADRQSLWGVTMLNAEASWKIDNFASSR